jgi:hypothetical protein
LPVSECVGTKTISERSWADIKLRDAILWCGAEAVVLALGGLAFWGATMVREGIIEGMFPWQLLKLHRLLLASSAWLVFVGLASSVSYLLHIRFDGSENSGQPLPSLR